jgi:hypothetical protein
MTSAVVASEIQGMTPPDNSMADVLRARSEGIMGERLLQRIRTLQQGARRWSPSRPIPRRASGRCGSSCYRLLVVTVLPIVTSPIRFVLV